MSVVPIKAVLTQQHLNESASSMAFQSNHSGAPQAVNSTPVHLSKEHLSSLWMKLTAIYGQLFISKHGVKDSGVWYESLKDLTPRALDSGVERLMTLSKGDKFCEFPPNCLQFRALCLGFYSELRMPKPAEAHREVLNRAYTTNPQWSHIVVKYTAKKLGYKFLEIINEGESFAVFKEAYEQVCHLVRQGHSVPEIKEGVMLPKPQSKDVATKHLNLMRQRLGIAS